MGNASRDGSVKSALRSIKAMPHDREKNIGRNDLRLLVILYKLRLQVSLEYIPPDIKCYSISFSFLRIALGAWID